MYIAIKARDNFGTCLVTGVSAMLAAHIFENIGMTMGIMPVTGIPLPFISYGGYCSERLYASSDETKTEA